MARREHLGELEQIVLLAVLRLGEDAYGVPIRLEIERRTRRALTVHERRPEMLSNLWIDARYAVRTFRRNPAFAAAAVVPIALGIGINTGGFSILNSVAWRPLPAPDSGELVSIYQEFRGVQPRRVHGARSMFSMPEYRVYQQNTRTLSA